MALSGDAGASSSGCAPSVAHTWGAPLSLSSNLTRTMGGSFVFSPCASGASGASFSPSLRLLAEGTDARVVSPIKSAYLPVLPLFSLDGPWTFLAPPKIVHLDDQGVASDFYVFASDPANFVTDFFQANVTVGAQSGSVARGLQMSTAASADGTLYVANSVTGEITKLDPARNPTTYASGLAGVMNLALRPDGTLLAAIPARFNSGTLESPPRIMTIAPGQSPQTFYTFPASGLDYGTGFLRMTGQEGLPIGFLVEMALSSDQSLYATLNTTGVLFKVDPVGVRTQLLDQLPTPIGVAVGGDGTVFLAFAPELSMGANVVAGAGAGIRVAQLGSDLTQTTVYQGPMRDGYNTGFLRSTGGPGPAMATTQSDAATAPPGGATTDPDASSTWIAQPMDAVAHLTVDPRGNLYLQDSLANELLMLPRQ
jgi:hypothetical protein